MLSTTSNSRITLTSTFSLITHKTDCKDTHFSFIICIFAPTIRIVYEIMSVYRFDMEMCYSMQFRSPIHELELCKQVGDVTGLIVHPRYQAASRDETPFDAMNLYTKLVDNRRVEQSGTVFYRNHLDGDTQENIIIENFPDIGACLE